MQKKVKKRDRKKLDLDYRERVRLLVTIGVSAAFVLAVAIFNYFLPFYSLLPGYSIPKIGEGEIRVHFLDIGQGDCTVIEIGRGECLVVDAGDGSFEHNNKLYRYLKGLGSPKLTLVVTHAETDHCGGMAPLFQWFTVEKVYLPVLESKNRVYQDILDEAEKRGVETQTLSRYSAISYSSDAYAVCISPYSIGETNENDASSVLFFSFQGVNLLLGADISSTRERRLMNEYAIDESIFDVGEYRVRLNEVDILRVSHHGSAYSSSDEWLKLLDAETAIVSAGRGNSYSHPAQEAITRLVQHVDEVYRIDELGDLIVTITEGQYSLSPLSGTKE